MQDPATALPANPPTSNATDLIGPQKPAARKRPTLKVSNGWGLANVAAISFSLTFVAGGVALLAGLLPRSVTVVEPPIDLGVLLLIVPVCALVLAMLAEVLRTAMHGLPRIRPARMAPVLSDWRPRRS